MDEEIKALLAEIDKKLFYVLVFIAFLAVVIGVKLIL